MFRDALVVFMAVLPCVALLALSRTCAEWRETPRQLLQAMLANERKLIAVTNNVLPLQREREEDNRLNAQMAEYNHGDHAQRDQVVAWAVFAFICQVAVALLSGGGIVMRRRLARANELLSEQETDLSTTLRSIGDAVIATDIEGRVTRMNPAAESLTGWSLADAARKPLEAIFYIVNAQTREPAVHPVRIALEKGEVVTLAPDTILVARDGSERHIADSAAPIKNAEGRIRGAVLVFHDVTAEYQVRERLQESEAMHRGLMENLPAGVIIVDPVTRKIENVNSHAATLFGAPEDQIVGRRCHSFLCPVQDGACPICDLDQVVDNSEKIMLRANGSRLPILKSVKRIQVQGREKLLECFVNITNHKRTEEDLRRAKQSLEQHVVALRFANQALEETSRVVESGAQAKGELLSNLSHEIRMTMTGILRYANRLLTEPGLEKAPTHRVEAFQTIAQNGRQLLTIIDNILDLSEIEARKLQVEWITCSLTSLLTEVVSLMQVQADAKGLPLILQYVGPVPETIHTDPARLRQILVNLIENAVKFTAAGEVRIVVRLLDGEGPTPKLACTVVDNGMGISPDQMKWLFEPFGQADAATNWNSNGTGLGLAVSKRLAELLDGEITVESVPGKGSSFTISLPIGSLMQVRMIEHSGNVAIPSVAQELPFSPGQPILTG